MKTSLAPDQALFRAECQIFKRSAGRSSTAAAAYRSASKITDRRTGEVFDYSRKHCVSAFIVAPKDSPAWTLDREELWNRVEASEKRLDAQVAREWLITIPRDLPQEQWEDFAREVVVPWVGAGAVVDVAVHCSLDMYGQPQPHLHIMLTMRELDPSTETGFAKKKNADLEAMHASGGRYGGERGDALIIQRERIADVMNTYLAAANSPRRVSHLSNAARGLEQEPEPTMGEQRVRKSHRLRKGDRVTDAVADHRKARALQNALQTIEGEIMSEFPRMQSDAENGIRPKHQQNFKASLIQSRLPGVNVNSNDVYMVEARDPKKPVKIQMRDGGWVEMDGRKAMVYGPRGQADKLAAAIVAADHADYIERLQEQAALTRHGHQPRQRQQATPSGDIAPAWKLPETAVESIADKWRSRGYTNVLEGADGVYITLGATRIQDLGDELRVHGKASEAAINALLAKADDEFGREVEIYGGQAFKDAVWLQAQRQAVMVRDPATGEMKLDAIKIYDRDTGKLYEPSPEIRAQFEADRAKLDAQKLDLEGVRQRKKIGDLMLEAANGSKEALQNLREADGYLWLLVTNLDEEQLAAFKTETVESIEQQLDGFRVLGREIEQEEKSEAQTPAPSPAPDDEPEPEKTKAPQPA
ncbi:MobA/MobL family protein [Brucella intermedia]|uniref:MobA/MobL family protein n=1 Tax=Brucella intermedia TaxID=94625 RepID=UPI00244ED47F|nr:MobA/MobL family protein [Brucella intermedia]WGJ06606.1 MobA/MobL family protein [Brucella intermedia]